MGELHRVAVHCLAGQGNPPPAAFAEVVVERV
jgi:hypothetical protein